jgi:hypothetical protein
MSETFVDQPTNPIPPPDTWHELSYNQLLDAKTQLMNKLYLARGKPLYLKPLNTALERIEAFIAAKLQDPRGLG